MDDHLRDATKMMDFISREAAIKTICGPCSCKLACDAGLEPVCSYYINLFQIPAADVVEVVHGTWEGETDFVYADLSQRVICDKCGAFAYFYDKMPMNFCPNCGADMREVKADG